MINGRLIRIKVLQVLYAHSKKNDKISSFSVEKELFLSIEKFYDLYLLMLLISVEMAQLEDERIEMRRNKNIRTKEDMDPSTRFAQNKIIEKIKTNQELIDNKKERKLQWKLHRNFLKRIYNEFIESELYSNYINSTDSSFQSDKKFLIKFYVEFLSENQAFLDFLEEENIYWNDDIGFATIMVVKSIENIKPDKKNNKILPLYKNEDDKDFAKKLLTTTIQKQEEYLDIISKHTQNWDTERIAQMDLLILQMAITELFEFKSIPVKVTLNEFIEISKYYSTEKSKIFINGILDNIIKHLEKDGSIVKTGRGLINS
jgi:transcription antitermination protein NusB